MTSVQQVSLLKKTLKTSIETPIFCFDIILTEKGGNSRYIMSNWQMEAIYAKLTNL
jgi:hypothetical protein